MRIQDHVSDRKHAGSDTGWLTGAVPPRHAPVYVRSRPMGRGWMWRSMAVSSEECEYRLFVQCHPSKDDWKAWLIEVNDASSVVCRLEHHGSHPGRHVHADCSKERPDGPLSIGSGIRIPAAKSHHRENIGHDPEAFWRYSKKFFRIVDRQGVLF